MHKNNGSRSRGDRGLNLVGVDIESICFNIHKDRGCAHCKYCTCRSNKGVRRNDYLITATDAQRTQAYLKGSGAVGAVYAKFGILKGCKLCLKLFPLSSFNRPPGAAMQHIEKRLLLCFIINRPLRPGVLCGIANRCTTIHCRSVAARQFVPSNQASRILRIAGVAPGAGVTSSASPNGPNASSNGSSAVSRTSRL